MKKLINTTSVNNSIYNFFEDIADGAVEIEVKAAHNKFNSLIRRCIGFKPKWNIQGKIIKINKKFPTLEKHNKQVKEALECQL